MKKKVQQQTKEEVELKMMQENLRRLKAKMKKKSGIRYIWVTDEAVTTNG